ncbi:hypothetical protein [Symbioplanes lichenis]|uniref:hypothetical protein n=1 Tax=Symbioplanes lichenis TaxID=1629072 RepID=UPI00273A38AA|nr:hypothetical protein [Actinoplanes lichenis]
MADGVRIETGQVAEVASKLAADADEGFASAVARSATLHAHGVVFGAAVPGGTMLAAKERYARALAYTDANLRAYRRMAALLAAQADQVVRDLGAADRISAQSQQRLADLLGQS